MNRTEMLAELREVINDDAVHPEWAESTLLGYLSEGQDKFCEDTGYFIDLSNFTLTLATGVSAYAFPDRIIEIIDIWNGAKKLEKVLTGSDFDSNGYDWSNTTGMPNQWRTDKETGVITLCPTPTITENGTELVLQVWRYSEVDLADVGADPEIPSRFHRALIEWAAYKAFMHHDAETQDPVKASDHLAAYKSYVNAGITAFRRQHGVEARVTCSPVYRT